MSEVDEQVREYLGRAEKLNPDLIYSRDTEVLIAQLLQTEEIQAKKKKVTKQRKRKDDEIYFDYDAKKWYNITDALVEELTSLCPQKDVKKEFEKMTVWLIKNMKTKRKQDFVKFVYGWFGRGE